MHARFVPRLEASLLGVAVTVVVSVTVAAMALDAFFAVVLDGKGIVSKDFRDVDFLVVVGKGIVSKDFSVVLVTAATP